MILRKRNVKKIISTPRAEFGADKLHTYVNYHVTLEFTKEHQEHCVEIVSTAENLSTIAEQLSILEPKKGQKPLMYILLFPCCKFNNDIWRNSKPDQLEEGWLSNIESLSLYDSLANKNVLKKGKTRD